MNQICTLTEEVKQASYNLYVHAITILDCFYKQSQYGFALADYQVAYEMSMSVNSGLHYRLAVVHYTLGMMDFSQKVMSLAEDHFTKALFHSPHTARFYTCRARIRNERNVSDI